MDILRGKVDPGREAGMQHSHEGNGTPDIQTRDTGHETRDRECGTGDAGKDTRNME